MKSKSFHIFQIDNQAEVDRLISALNALPGVKSVVGDYQTKIYAIQWSDPTEWDDIEKTILTLNYVPETL